MQRRADVRRVAAVTAVTRPAQPAPTISPSRPWSVELPAIGQPVAAGDVAVVHTAEKGARSLVAVDARTGRVLWTRPASPGFVVPGIAVTPDVVQDEEGSEYVAYFRPIWIPA